MLSRIFYMYVYLLTPRQKQVARLVSHGYTNQEIAKKLFIEPNVVSWHLTPVYSELRNALEKKETDRMSRALLAHWLTRLFEAYPDLNVNDESEDAQT